MMARELLYRNLRAENALFFGNNDEHRVSSLCDYPMNDELN